MTELSGWLTIAEAAAALQTSSRSIERRIKAGEIEAQPRPRPVCNPADIERLKPPAFLLPTKAAATGLPAGPNGAAALEKSNEIFRVPAALELLAAIAGRAPSETPAPRCWLTLSEAAEASGLSAAKLKQLAKAGEIPALRDYRQWKIHLPSLLHWTPGISQSPKTSTAESPPSSASSR